MADVATPDTRLDGVGAAQLARLLDLPRVELLERTTSTLDVAHRLAAEGAAAGTLVIAEEQTAGRGRAGRRWASAPGAGLWLTLIERPADASALEVLSLRLGLRAARVLDRFAASPVRLKWPNDLYVGVGKLAGILVEARWRDGRPDWTAIGFGLNVVAPTHVTPAAGLRPGTSRIEVLAELVPALRAAATARGGLGEEELQAFAERDLARGRRCSAPAAGIVRGIDARGALLVESDQVRACREGSLVLQEET